MSTTTRNSIIELMRLLASLWVVYYHNMFFVANNTTGYFASGKIAVDFFFMLSGLFFIKSYNAYKESSLASNFASFTWKRLKGMGVALPIGLVFSTIYFIIFPTNNYGTNFIFGYLWFIPAMFVALLFYFVVFEIKNAKAKTLIVVTIVVACYILAFIFRELRIFSAFAGIGLGILVSIIPKIPLLENKKIVAVVLSLILMALCVLFSFLPKTHSWVELTLIFLLFTSFLYVCRHFTVSIPAFNYLGKLSFGVYAMQSVVRLFRDCNILTENVVMFAIIFVAANVCLIVDHLWMKFVKKQRRANALVTTTTKV